MRPYRVEEAVFKTGYAEESECGLILSVLEGPAEPPKGRCEPSLTDPPTSTIRKIGRESSEVPTLNPSENKSGLERGDARH